MLIGTLPIILILSKIIAMEVINPIVVEPAKELSDQKVILRSEEMSRIKNFLQSIDRYKDNNDHTSMKDPSGYCRSFENCFECVKSLWFPCGWCHNYGCTESPEALCPYAETKADKSNLTGEVKGCPHIEHDGPVAVQSGELTTIKVQLYVPDPALYNKEIICQIKVGQRTTHLKGLLVNDFVHCFPVVLNSYAKLYGETDRGTLTLLWGGAQPFSNKVPLIVYDCEVLAPNCELCRRIPANYGCGWCDSIAKCVNKEKCQSKSNWTRNRMTCENYGRALTYGLKEQPVY
ncbi:hypothetical protein PYW08_011961 [Mythimna loreyi]|uniref:Uncharacterized protein n=1 Tax=Mythimna loreyi TaxID=667449 RepID=A0ACC2QLF3_9NEOP|nr:hypothetical protein PYW08_011961 [Mythimna loreyi]